jgi:hypothetical protein
MPANNHRSRVSPDPILIEPHTAPLDRPHSSHFRTRGLIHRDAFSTHCGPPYREHHHARVLFLEQDSFLFSVASFSIQMLRVGQTFENRGGK